MLSDNIRPVLLQCGSVAVFHFDLWLGSLSEIRLVAQRSWYGKDCLTNRESSMYGL